MCASKDADKSYDSIKVETEYIGCHGDDDEFHLFCGMRIAVIHQLGGNAFVDGVGVI